MIPRKTLTVFFATVFVAAIGFNFMLENGESKEVKSFFPDRNQWELKRISITDDNDKSLVFKRVKCVWVIGDDNMPSDEIKATALAEKLLNLQSDDLVTEKEGDHERLKVSSSQFSRKVELNFKDETSMTLLLGEATMGRPDHARRVDETGVYLIYEPKITKISLEPNVWFGSADDVSGVSTK